MLKIALDYDQTYTADKLLWNRFIKLAINMDHEIKFVTARFENADTYHNKDWRTNADIEADANQLGIDIVYCNHKPKQEVYNADIWIDDRPATIIAPTILINPLRDVA